MEENLVYKMNPEIKELWVKALRSGEYKQGTFILRSENDEYCCLGVLCDLHIKDHKNYKWKYDAYYGRYSCHLGTEMPPIEVVDWSGIEDQPIYYKGEYTTLTELNDVEKLTFNQIAEKIEEQM